MLHAGIIAEAGLSQHSREASAYVAVLDAFDYYGYNATTDALAPELARMRRQVLGWLAPGVTLGPLKCLFALVEFEVRGRVADSECLGNILDRVNAANVSHQFTAAQRWAQFKHNIH